MADPRVQDLLSLDRDVARGRKALERWRAGMARTPDDFSGDDPLEPVRHVAGKSTWDALRSLAPGLADSLLRDALVPWVGTLTLARLGREEEIEQAEAMTEATSRLALDVVQLVSWRQAWRGIAPSRSASEAAQWLDAAAGASGQLAAIAQRKAATRVEVARRLGLEHPWDLLGVGSASTMRAAAHRLLDATEELSRAVWKETLAGVVGAAAVLSAAVAREAGDGWPDAADGPVARRGDARSHDRAQDLRCRRPLEPIGASSFARALGMFGFALREAWLPAQMPFALGHEPGARAAHRFGFVLGALPANPHWQEKSPRRRAALRRSPSRACSPARCCSRCGRRPSACFWETTPTRLRGIWSQEASSRACWARRSTLACGAPAAHREGRRPVAPRRPDRIALVRRRSSRPLRRRLVPQPESLDAPARIGRVPRARAGRRRSALASGRRPGPRPRGGARMKAAVASIAVLVASIGSAHAKPTPPRGRVPTRPCLPPHVYVRPAPPLPMMPGVARVRVEAARDHVRPPRGGLALPRGTGSPGGWTFFVAFGAPGTPPAVDPARLVAVPVGATEARSDDPGEPVVVEPAVRHLPSAQLLLGRPSMAGVVVRVKDLQLRHGYALSDLLLLRVRSLAAAAGDGRRGHARRRRPPRHRGARRRSRWAKCRSCRSSRSPGSLRAEASLCGPDADPWPLSRGAAAEARRTHRRTADDRAVDGRAARE